jgi:hypothetical protein
VREYLFLQQCENLLKPYYGSPFICVFSDYLMITLTSYDYSINPFLFQ